MPFVKGPLPQRLKLAHGFGAVAFFAFFAAAVVARNAARSSSVGAR